MPNDAVNWARLRRIVVVQKKNLGDAVLLLPVIEKLYQLNPALQIQIVTGDAHRTIFHSFCDAECIEMPRTILGWIRVYSQISEPDLFLDFQNSRKYRLLGYVLRARIRSGVPVARALFRDTHPLPFRPHLVRHQIETNLDVLRRLGAALPYMDAIVRSEYRKSSALDSTMRESEDPYFVLHPGSRWMFKSMLLDQWEALVVALYQEYGLLIRVTGGDSDMEQRLAQRLALLPGVENLCGQTSLTELMELIRNARAFIGVDTFAAHLANTLAKPGVVIFGPSDARRWGPRANDTLLFVRSAEAVFPCMPCNIDGCGGGKVSECLRALKTSDILETFAEALSHSPA